LVGLLAIGAWLGPPPGAIDWSVSLFGRDRLLLALALLLLVIMIGAATWKWLPGVHQKAIGLIKRYVRKNPAQWTWKKLCTILLIGYVYSMASTLLLVVAYWAAFKALTVSVPVSAAFWLVCAVSLAVLVPLTVNGLGLQEGIFVLVLGQYGISAEAALGVALFIRLLTLIYSALGGLMAIGMPIRQQKSTILL
jgi:uncharacterized membrane protein YbhN (UPF0104 family)